MRYCFGLLASLAGACAGDVLVIGAVDALIVVLVQVEVRALVVAVDFVTWLFAPELMWSEFAVVVLSFAEDFADLELKVY